MSKMSRLTIKTKRDVEFYITDDTKCMSNKYINKLGKLEDLEEELGCPLDVLHKALKDGIYAKDPLDENKLKYILIVALSNGDSEWHLSNHCFCVNVRDYKELFWLKEDKSE